MNGGFQNEEGLGLIGIGCIFCFFGRCLYDCSIQGGGGNQLYDG